MSSIATRSGDEGFTGLMYDRRVPKTHPQVEVCGTIDELSACMTMARTLTQDLPLKHEIYQIQQDLVGLMAELALDPQDWERYAASIMTKMEPARLERLDKLIEKLEAGGIVFRDWNVLGFSAAGATLEQARTICRRAERCYWRLDAKWHQEKPLLGRYLNRLADALWLLARRDLLRG